MIILRSFFIIPMLRVRLKAGYQVREAFPSYVVHGRKGSFLKSRGDVQEAMLVAIHKPNLADWGTEPESEQGLLHTEKNGEVIRKKYQRCRVIIMIITMAFINPSVIINLCR
jgi:phytoene dehydrogenase-like protein